MKKRKTEIIFLVFCLMIFGLSKFSSAEENNVIIDVSQGQENYNDLGEQNTNNTLENQIATEQSQTQYGGNQSMIFNSYGDGKTTIRSQIHSYPYGEFMPSPITPIRDDNWKIWQNVPFFRGVGKDLYTSDQLKTTLEDNKDVIQLSLNYKYPPNYERVFTVPGYLGGENDILIGTLEFEGPINGHEEETIKRAASLAALYGACRICVKTWRVPNAWAASNGIGSAANYSFMGGDGASALGVAPRNGKAQSREFKIFKVAVYFYNQGSLTPTIGTSKKELETKENFRPPGISVKNGKFDCLPMDNVARTLSLKWEEISADNKKICIIGYTSNNDSLAIMDNAAYDAMLYLAKKLYVSGINESSIIETVSSKSEVATDEKLCDYIISHNLTGHILISIN